MRTSTSWLLPAAFAAGAGLLLLPAPPTEAYGLIGGSLSTTQRDVRIFNNFGDPSSNNNTTPDNNFPGYDGAELSVWKAVVEWSSELHGGGFGDPVQVGGIGSGGANFDPSWQGNATDVGSSNQNIHSELSGSNGGVLAFTETPISDGWRIRYYSNWQWNDGPDAGFGGTDLQGVACHEYGHALGLGHTSVSGATMYPTIGGNGSAQRSIEADDMAGVQAVYGLKSATKPHIGSTSVAGSTLTLDGANFTTTNNEVWFTKSGTGGDGTPVKVTGVASTGGGTKITVTMPGSAGKGDVLVKKNVSGNSSLSNAFPFSPTGNLPAGPIVTGSSPAGVPVLAVGANTFTLSGSGFTGTADVKVDGLDTGFGVQSDTSLSVNMPLVSHLGPVSVSVTTYAGVGTGTVNVVAPLAPVVRFEQPVLLNGQTLTTTLGSAVGDIALVLVSTQLTPSSLPGLFTLDIGAGLTDLLLFKIQAIPAKGWAQINAPLAGIPANTTIYAQLLVVPAANPTAPFPVSNVTNTLVLF